MKNTKNSTRHAVVDYDKCRPNKCGKQCVVKCPPNQTGKKCIVVEDIEDYGKKAMIYTDLCIGCGLCVKFCPFGAIRIVNIPSELSTDKLLYSYGANSFRVYMYPSIKKGSCLGILGGNGLGKSTIIKILSNEQKLNLNEMKGFLSGSEFYGYLTKLYNGEITVSYKPQDITTYGKGRKGNIDVSSLLMKITEKYVKMFDLEKLKERKVQQLSGGEMQRVLISLALSKQSDGYLFDEPSAFLDIKQRIIMSDGIKEKIDNSYVVLIEHDLCVFDYISDYVCCFYGEKGAYGVVSSLSGTFNGINNYLDGYLPSENVQIRDKPIKFKNINIDEEEICRRTTFKYSSTTKTYSNFKLEISSGDFSTSEIILLIGENGTGKTTMIKLLSGMLKGDTEWDYPEMKISIKEQDIYSSETITEVEQSLTVRDYLFKKIGNMALDQEFKVLVLNPLKVDMMYDLLIENLSGGQRQKLLLVECLGKVSDIYLLDEPSAYVDVEDRINMAKVIRQFTYQRGKTTFIVEHDLILATSISDKVIVFEGIPSVSCKASQPLSLKEGIDKFLKELGVTMRKDKSTGRPRINKKLSMKDREQKTSGNYFIIE